MKMPKMTTHNARRNWLRVLAGCALVAFAAPAGAEMVLSKVILDLHPGRPAFDDIEVWNDGTERMYVLAETSEIVSPGLPEQRRVQNPDPSVSGLLVAPQRLVLEPGQRRIVRVSAVAQRGAADRVYRVTIKPVAGAISAEASALKVFVGYDVLVLYRPATVTGELTSARTGRRFSLKNAGNTAVEIFDGRQCDAIGSNCMNLVATRLYAGASLEQDLPFETPVEYRVSSGRTTVLRRF